jgi:hypothetical protein
VNEKDVKKYMTFSKKNKIPIQEAVKRYVITNHLTSEDYRVVYGIADMVYTREMAA